MKQLGTQLLFALIAASFLPLGSAAQQPPWSDTGSVVQTSGSAELTLQPTRAIITFAVQSRAVTAAQAASSNGPKIRKLVAALRQSRPAPDSVLVIGVSVGPNENQQRGTIVDYRARAELRLVVTNLDSLGRYLDVALTNGATEVSDVSFTSDSSEVAGRTALAQAYTQAYGKAQALARAAGGELGPLLHLATGPDYLSFGYASGRAYSAAQFESSGSEVPITAQGVTVSAAVSAAWRFEARH